MPTKRLAIFILTCNYISLNLNASSILNISVQLVPVLFKESTIL